MCGVFGYASLNGSPINPKILERLAAVTERRGPHAWGLAWIDGEGRMHCYKQAGRVTQALGLLRMARDARYLIGHCRYATQGNPAQNLNNHPHPCDGGWIVHNGVIPHYQSLLWRFHLNPVSDCDSEVIGLRIEQEKGNLLDRCAETVLSLPRCNLVVLGLWKPGRLIAIRQGNPLHVGSTPGGFYLASLADELPGKPRSMYENTISEVSKEFPYVRLG